ncbi:MAG: hypothetical protein IPJ98_06675 [Bryobacterales bacterium]|nr:hypothetical protein [Bryobacterales bacterium]
MPPPLTAEETIDRLAKTISPAYAALRDFTSPQVRAAAAAIIDLMVEEQLSVPRRLSRRLFAGRHAGPARSHRDAEHLARHGCRRAARAQNGGLHT